MRKLQNFYIYSQIPDQSAKRTHFKSYLLIPFSQGFIADFIYF